MSETYRMNSNGTVYPIQDLIEWGKWFGTADRKIAHSTATSPDGKVEVEVSTVFLGLDHNFGGGEPILFETMAFCSTDEEINQDQDRYSTIQEAKIGHAKMFVKIRRYLKKKYPNNGEEM